MKSHVAPRMGIVDGWADHVNEEVVPSFRPQLSQEPEMECISQWLMQRQPLIVESELVRSSRCANFTRAFVKGGWYGSIVIRGTRCRVRKYSGERHSKICSRINDMTHEGRAWGRTRFWKCSPWLRSISINQRPQEEHESIWQNATSYYLARPGGMGEIVNDGPCFIPYLRVHQKKFTRKMG